MTDLLAVRTGGERTQLDGFLDDGRAEVIEVLTGLDDGQARRRLVPSLTCPLAILKHLVFVEQNWFHVTLAGRTRADVGTFEDAEQSWVPAEQDTVVGLLADYRRVCAEARAIAAAYDLDHVVVHRRLGEVSLRWLLLHVIRETARHAGHADILVEQIRAADG